ncbi:peroxiredoxin family protein [Roseibacillus persicicus]|uniref:peroxiredoxin family protein n=1 Tax=Roseibacillus persicicus TaxID=454148 RepID=UPI0028107A55|nr:TlpA disulfide reductase family protein [Roseibacillus persicicus]MDQ8191213.1 TlpA disulfide reductase family protein [Roseibacillus persicicus]
MKHFIFTILLSVLCLPSLHADEAGAKKVIDQYEAEVNAWVTKINAAPDIAARRELWKVIPDPDAFGLRLLRQLDGAWNQPWFLDYAPKLLQLAPAFSVKPVSENSTKTPLSVVRDSADRFHFASPKVGPLCLALVADSGPATRKFLEKVEANHPDKKVQGQAAMALALLSRELGDGGGFAQFKAQRIDWIRKAIIEAADVEVGNTTVGKMAEEFLFSISKLDKGMEAPDILGWNVSEQAMRLSDYRGKPVIIVFWHTRMQASEETMAFLRKLEDRLGPKGVAVLGVASESRPALREMVKSGSVTWKNWLDANGKIAKLYQVTDYPACWVLDGAGKVQYRGVPGPFAELTAEALVK